MNCMDLYPMRVVTEGPQMSQMGFIKGAFCDSYDYFLPLSDWLCVIQMIWYLHLMLPEVWKVEETSSFFLKW